jgi:hypothetical protein
MFARDKCRNYFLLGHHFRFPFHVRHIYSPYCSSSIVVTVHFISFTISSSLEHFLCIFTHYSERSFHLLALFRNNSFPYPCHFLSSLMTEYRLLLFRKICSRYSDHIRFTVPVVYLVFPSYPTNEIRLRKT